MYLVHVVLDSVLGLTLPRAQTHFLGYQTEQARSYQRKGDTYLFIHQAANSRISSPCFGCRSPQYRRYPIRFNSIPLLRMTNLYEDLFHPLGLSASSSFGLVFYRLLSIPPRSFPVNTLSTVFHSSGRAYHPHPMSIFSSFFFSSIYGHTFHKSRSRLGPLPHRLIIIQGLRPTSSPFGASACLSQSPF